jgi:hypothetical protein
MVTIRLEDVRRIRMSTHDDARIPNDPQAKIALLNDRIAHMSKSMETLTRQNAAVLLQIPDHSNMAPGNRNEVLMREKEAEHSC